MPKIFLHIGLHKTASSSFQLSCFSNKYILDKQKILYPTFECFGLQENKSIINHSVPLFSLFSKEYENYSVHIRWGVDNHIAAQNGYRQQLDAALGNDTDIILSGEDISSLDSHELSDVLNYLQKTGRDLIPIALVRSPYAFHCSQLQQQVKDGVAMNPVGLCPQRHKIRKLKTIFGASLHWLPFSQACLHPQGPVGSLLEFCGINPATINIHNTNQGRSAELVCIQNLLNHHQPRIRNSALNDRHVRLMPFRGSPFLLSPKQLSEVEDHLNFENAEIENLLGPGFGDLNRPTSKALFSDPFPALAYSLLGLIGLLLQQQTNPVVTSLSLQDIQMFLLEACDEEVLRQTACLDRRSLTQPLLEPTTTTTESFPDPLIPLAQQFINRL